MWVPRQHSVPRNAGVLPSARRNAFRRCVNLAVSEHHLQNRIVHGNLNVGQSQRLKKARDLIEPWFAVAMEVWDGSQWHLKNGTDAGPKTCTPLAYPILNYRYHPSTSNQVIRPAKR